MGLLMWLEESSLAEWIRMSTVGYPMMISLHAVGMSIMVGLCLALDLRLLGLFPGLPFASLHKFLRVAWIGFAVNFVSGTCLFIAQATEFITHGTFLTKMALIVVGVAATAYLQTTIGGAAGERKDGAALAPAIRGVAILSVVVWVGAITAGRLTAYL